MQESLGNLLRGLGLCHVHICVPTIVPSNWSNSINDFLPSEQRSLELML